MMRDITWRGLGVVGWKGAAHLLRGPRYYVARDLQDLLAASCSLRGPILPSSQPLYRGLRGFAYAIVLDVTVREHLDPRGEHVTASLPVEGSPARIVAPLYVVEDSRTSVLTSWSDESSLRSLRDVTFTEGYRIGERAEAVVFCVHRESGSFAITNLSHRSCQGRNGRLRDLLVSYA